MEDRRTEQGLKDLCSLDGQRTQEMSKLRCGDSEESSQMVQVFLRLPVRLAGLCGGRMFGH